MIKKKLIIGITAPGSVILLEGQLKYFTNLGYETYLMAPEEERTRLFCEREGCLLLRVNIEREISLVSDIRALFQIIRYFRKIKPNIVNVGTPKMGLLGIIAAKFTGIKKRIYTCRGYRFEHEKGVKRKILILMEQITAFYAHQVICISASVREVGIETKIFSKEKGIVIHKGSSNGIPLACFNPQNVNPEQTLKLKQQLMLENTFVYGYVGRLVDRKGINELFVSFLDLYSKNNQLCLVFVGSPEYEQIADKTLIDKMKNHPGIILVGSQKDVPLYLSVMDVFVLPAWWEGFGNVLVQAAAMGLPVISTTGTGTRDAVENNLNGILISPKSVQELTDAMKQLYDNKDLRIQLGKNGVEWAKNFDNKIIWDGMEQLYRN